VRKLLIFDAGQTDLPVVPHCSSAVIGPYHGRDVSVPTFSGEGKGPTQEDAIRSAIGEGIERYAASIWDPTLLTYARYSELGDGAFNPRWLVLYDDEQYRAPDFPYSRFDPEQPIHWATGQWLDTGDVVVIPALATFMNFPAPDSEQFGQTTSNGLAAGASAEDATLRALYELIERDAFMLFWLARLPGVRIDDRGCTGITREALLGVHRLGARTELYLVDAGTGHPTVVCVGLGDGVSWPGATVGLGTHADIDVALQKAALEHAHFGVYIRRLMRESEHERISAPEAVHKALDHALYYLEPERTSALQAFRRNTEVPTPLEELRSKYQLDATVDACVTRLRDAGIRTATVDVTSPDVALSPLRVIRAFGTNMQPIHFGVANRRLRNPRLRILLNGSVEVLPHPIA